MLQNLIGAAGPCSIHIKDELLLTLPAVAEFKVFWTVDVAK
jgi:hypothetical protein